MKLNNQKNFLFFALLLVVLALGNVPYINVVFLDKLGFLYIFLLLFLLLPLSYRFFFLTATLLWLLSLGTALLKLNNYTEILGVMVYFFIWLAFVYKARKLIRELRKK